MSVLNQISVIPTLNFGKVHIKSIRQFLDFFRCKACIRCKLAHIRHRKFVKHIERGMCTVFLYRQNTRHIYKCNISLVLKQLSHKIKICLLFRHVIRIFSENAVPLVYNYNKLLARFRIDFFKDLRKHKIIILYGIFFAHFRNDLLLHISRHL